MGNESFSSVAGIADPGYNLDIVAARDQRRTHGDDLTIVTRYYPARILDSCNLNYTNCQPLQTNLKIIIVNPYIP
jgi:hypothetical protein